MEILLAVNCITRGIELLLMGCIYYSRDEHITRGNKILLAGTKYYSRERNITRGNEYYSREPNITRGDQILLAGTIYYSWELNITRGNVLITRGAEKLLAGTKYYSREYNITRGNELLLAGKNITCGKELLLAGIYLLLAGTIYYSRERNIGSIWHQRASVVRGGYHPHLLMCELTCIWSLFLTMHQSRISMAVVIVCFNVLLANGITPEHISWNLLWDQRSQTNLILHEWNKKTTHGSNQR